ncbi:MAG: type II secretion system minor pseudopilin [Candidatus Anammoxibacter sp.]
MGWYFREQLAKGNKGSDNERRNRKRADSVCDGYVFVIVLWVMVVLSFIAIGSLRSTRVSVNLEKVFEDRLKDIYAAKNACLFALMKLQVSGVGAQVGSETVSRIGIGVEADDLDIFAKPWEPNPEPYLISINDMNCDVHIDDEGGKINLNSINDDNMDILIDFLIANDVEEKNAETITDSVIDWKDNDDLHHIEGAETSYYESLPEPYKAKNAPFDSIEELLLVKGVTPLIFDNIRDGITVYGSEKININFAGSDVLLSIPGFDEEIVISLLMHIEDNGPINNDEELRTIFFGLGIAGASFEDIRKFITVKTQNFVTIRSVCSLSDSIGEGNSQHQYRIVAEINGNNLKILAVYPD